MLAKKEVPQRVIDRLYYKYSHVGCPSVQMEDNCPHPQQCAENGRCIDLGPNPMDKGEQA